jgi:hypothetical protein
LKEAQRAEIAEMQTELAQDPHGSLVREAGLPRAFQSRALLASIARGLAA